MSDLTPLMSPDAGCQLPLDPSAWYNALTLTERTAILRNGQPGSTRRKIDAERAQRRLQRWKSHAPFATGSFFAERLAMDGITEEVLLTLLGETAPSGEDRQPAVQQPVWAIDIAHAFAHASYLSIDTLPGLSTVRDQKESGFLIAIAPLITRGYERLCHKIEVLTRRYTDLPFDPATVPPLLIGSLSAHLLKLISPTMVLELHIARLQGVLQGDTPEARFQNFLDHVAEPGVALALLQQYPVLARQVTTHIEQWVTASLEFLEHVCQDWQVIQELFSSHQHPGLLTAVECDASDRHRGGRTVMIATFGSGLQLVYKPKSLSIDVHFQQLLTWLNERSSLPPFRTLAVLDRGTYGWTEFIHARGCTSQEAIQAFYQRLGGYLALLYILEATDFHFDNLIAAADQPMLIDLEALFHPNIDESTAQDSQMLASIRTRFSVLRVGLLPQRIWANKEFEGVDVSGLGGSGGQLSSSSVPMWDNMGTDQMCLTRQRITISEGRNRPLLNGAHVSTVDYADDFVAGFTAMYRLLLQHREVLLAKDGPLSWFADDEIRVIFRSTRSYGRLLKESTHPDILHDALDRDRFWGWLWSEVQNRPFLARMIPFEHHDLQQGDVPIFTTRPGSHDLWSSTHVRIPGIFEAPSMALVRRGLEQLSEEDLAQQLWFIRASFATLLHGDQQLQSLGEDQQASCPSVDREVLLRAACAIGDRLKALAVRTNNTISWTGLTLQHERFWSIAPLGMDLYDGLPGVALFLAHLGTVTGRPAYTLLAREALEAIRLQIEALESSLISVGGFDGWGGMLYVLTRLAVLWDDSTLLAEAEELVERIATCVDQDTSFDIICGTAGSLASLLSLYKTSPSPRTLAIAVKCGERLLDQALVTEHGRAWMTPAAETQPLAGFGHGTAGIAWTLLELSAVTHDDRFRMAARSAIQYERGLFDPERGDWRDVREQLARTVNNGRELSVVGWCYGAAGIGLARLSSLPFLDDAELREEIDVALKTTLERGFGANHSLCHGDLGNIEVVALANAKLNSPDVTRQLDRVTATVLNSIDRKGWQCAVPLGIESPGLMTGLAGIGYGLLRLAEPTAVPSVLLLAPAAKPV